MHCPAHSLWFHLACAYDLAISNRDRCGPLLVHWNEYCGDLCLCIFNDAANGIWYYCDIISFVFILCNMWFGNRNSICIQWKEICRPVAFFTGSFKISINSLQNFFYSRWSTIYNYNITYPTLTQKATFIKKKIMFEISWNWIESK